MKDKYKEAYKNLLILGWTLVTVMVFLLIMQVYEGELEREKDRLQWEVNFFKDFLRDEGYLLHEDYFEKGQYQCKFYKVNGNDMTICTTNDVLEREEVRE